MTTLRVVNNRGRVLLAITGARIGKAGTVYDYASPGGGGWSLTREDIERSIECIVLDNPSAKRIGEFPELPADESSMRTENYYTNLNDRRRC